MLSRPEIGTRAHILLWLESKDPDAVYHWMPWTECPCALYGLEHGIPDVENAPWDSPISSLAGEFPRTWGALAERARKAENGSASNPWKD